MEIIDSDNINFFFNFSNENEEILRKPSLDYMLSQSPKRLFSKKEKKEEKKKQKVFPSNKNTSPSSELNFSDPTTEEMKKSQKILLDKLKENEMNTEICIEISEEIIQEKDKNKKFIDKKVKRWTAEESKLYESFIEKYFDLMGETSSKRNAKIFLVMSNFIQGKTPSQCRSHHQKFYKKVVQNLLEKKKNMKNSSESEKKFKNNKKKSHEKIFDKNLESNLLRKKSIEYKSKIF